LAQPSGFVTPVKAGISADEDAACLFSPFAGGVSAAEDARNLNALNTRLKKRLDDVQRTAKKCAPLRCVTWALRWFVSRACVRAAQARPGARRGARRRRGGHGGRLRRRHRRRHARAPSPGACPQAMTFHCVATPDARLMYALARLRQQQALTWTWQRCVRTCCARSTSWAVCCSLCRLPLR
jgi:hypothetical protein